MEHVVVVGSSLAGLRAGETLRTEGFTGRITLVGAERHQPYDRPPLSKQVLAGTWEPDRIALRRGDGVAALGMDLQLGVPAVALDTEARSVTLADGRELPFDGLVVATGSSPRRVPGQLDLPNVHELRTLDDALALRARLADGGPRVVVVGAGFIGLEVAATATGHGCRVTVLEAAPAPLIRGLGAALGAAVVDAVSGRVGFDVRCGSAIAALEPDGVRLAGGSLVTADVVVVGIGVSPATAWLDGSGLDVRDGVVCDATLATGVPGIVAAGDVARWYHTGLGEELRIEHWTNAAEQGAAAARTLLAQAAGSVAAPYAPVPFFWSDMGRQRIQLVGRGVDEAAGDEISYAIGSPDDERFLALVRRGDRLRGAVGLNAPRLVMPYNALLAGAASWDDAQTLAAAQRGNQQS